MKITPFQMNYKRKKNSTVFFFFWGKYKQLYQKYWLTLKNVQTDMVDSFFFNFIEQSNSGGHLRPTSAEIKECSVSLCWFMWVIVCHSCPFHTLFLPLQHFPSRWNSCNAFKKFIQHSTSNLRWPYTANKNHRSSLPDSLFKRLIVRLHFI